MKTLIKIVVSILVLGCVVISVSHCGKEEITKEQQENIVKRIAQSYEIQSIEFLSFKKNVKTGYYRLTFKIDSEDRYITGISLSSKERLDNVVDEIGLSPVDNFKELERKERISLEEIDMNKIEVKYI